MNPTAPRSSFDFDDWAGLAARDLAAFEQRRTRAIDETILQAPEHRRARLRRLQWRIDQTRRLAPSPLAACVQLSQLMWDSVLGDGGMLQALHGQPPRTGRRAEILAFPPADRAQDR
jgi:hypothetical protein